MRKLKIGRVVTSKRKHSDSVANNLLSQQFNPEHEVIPIPLIKFPN